MDKISNLLVFTIIIFGSHILYNNELRKSLKVFQYFVLVIQHINGGLPDSGKDWIKSY